MGKRDYDQQILKRIEKSIDGLLPIGSLIALIGVFNVYLTGRNVFLAVFDVAFSVILLLLFAFRRRIQPAHKIAAICSLIFIMAFLSLYLTGIISIGPQLLILCSILVVGFFSNQISALYAYSKALILILFVLLVQFGHLNYDGAYAAVSNDAKNWYMPVILLILLDVVLILVIDAIKRYLIASIKTSDGHEARILQLAFYDPLTNLPNKAKVIDAYQGKVIKDAVVIHFRIDGFSMMNTIYGNQRTDEYIIALAEHLKARETIEQHIARLGGNEFLWIMQGLSLQQALDRYEALTSELRQLETGQYARSILAFYAGYLVVSHEGASLETVLEETAIALEQAKIKQAVFPLPYDRESERQFIAQEGLKSALTKAIQDKGFKIYYQEKVDTKNLKVMGVEALARWEITPSQFVSPGIFIPLLKKINATMEFDLMITELVFKEYHLLRQKYAHPLTVSINISPLSLITDPFIDGLFALTDLYEMDSKYVYFELTEDAFFESFDDALNGIERLKSKGFKIAIDDFGSGYTALSYIFKLKFDELKMDRSFVNQLAQSPVNRAILKTVIDLREVVDFTIVAEGVETTSECELLQQMGCWQVQGYLFSKPLPFKAIEMKNDTLKESKDTTL